MVENGLARLVLGAVAALLVVQRLGPGWGRLLHTVYSNSRPGVPTFEVHC